MKTGAAFNRATSRQDIETPSDFMAAVVKLYGPIGWDLAADFDNNKAVANNAYYDEKDDSLKQDWNALDGNLWLNPPFGRIPEFAAKCAASKPKLRILFLTPASIGANWFRDYVYPNAYVHALNGRITFVGQTQPYPKDCILSVFGCPRYHVTGFSPWKWRE